MTLIDTGPLLAIFNGNDEQHAVCVETLARLRLPLITTWACLAETMHLLGKIRGYSAQDALWGYIESEALEVHIHEASERRLMRAFMQRYRDTPMDLADASLVVAAHSLNTRRVFTLDSDFFVYRLPNGEALEVVPQR